MSKEMDNIDELRQKESDLLLELHKVREQISVLKDKDNEVKGKFVDLLEFGRMYVTWEDRTNNNIYLQGFSYKSCASPYSDDFYIAADAMNELNINIEWWEKNRKNIKELTKEEFIGGYLSGALLFNTKFEPMLDAIIKNYEADD